MMDDLAFHFLSERSNDYTHCVQQQVLVDRVNQVHKLWQHLHIQGNGKKVTQADAFRVRFHRNIAIGLLHQLCIFMKINIVFLSKNSNLKQCTAEDSGRKHGLTLCSCWPPPSLLKTEHLYSICVRKWEESSLMRVRWTI